MREQHRRRCNRAIQCPRKSATQGWRRHEARRGVTLLELLVTLSLLAIVSAIALPALTTLKSTQDPLDAATTIRRLVARARALATAEGRVVYIRFDTGSGHYWLGQERPDADTVFVDSAVVLAAGQTMLPRETRTELRITPFGESYGDLPILKQGDQYLNLLDASRD